MDTSPSNVRPLVAWASRRLGGGGAAPEMKNRQTPPGLTPRQTHSTSGHLRKSHVALVGVGVWKPALPGLASLRMRPNGPQSLAHRIMDGPEAQHSEQGEVRHRPTNANRPRPTVVDNYAIAPPRHNLTMKRRLAKAKAARKRHNSPYCKY